MEGWFFVVALIGGPNPGKLGVQQCSGMFTQWSVIPHVARLADTPPTLTENFYKASSIINAMLIFI